MIKWKPTPEVIKVYMKSDAMVPYLEIKGTIRSADVVEQYIPLLEEILKELKNKRVAMVEIVDGSEVKNCIPRHHVPEAIFKKFKQMENQYNGVIEQKESLEKKAEPICSISRSDKGKYAMDAFYALKKK